MGRRHDALRPPRTDRNGDAIALQYGVNLLAFTARADLAHQVTEIGVSGWDVAAKDAIDEVGDESAIAVRTQRR